MTETTITDTKLKRHPIRGFLWGIFFGLGLALITVGQGWAALGTWPPFIVLIVGIIVGTLWATFGPAKAPKGPPPAGATLADEPAPEPEPVPESFDAAEPVPKPFEAAEPVVEPFEAAPPLEAEGDDPPT